MSTTRTTFGEVWGCQFFQNTQGILCALDITRFRPLPAGLISPQHPWAIGLNPATGAPEIPWGPQRRMPHGINYIHCSAHYNSGILVFTDFADAIGHFTDRRFAAEVRRFVRRERREILVMFRQREYSTREYAYYVGCMRTLFPWFCNSNGPLKRVLWGNPSPFPVANIITGNWIRDIYRLKRPGGSDGAAKRVVRVGDAARAAHRAAAARRIHARSGGANGLRTKPAPRPVIGVQQQRVALVIEPIVLLLDEPLANLDRQLREQLRGELKELQRRSGVTTLLVTHDRDEALTLADQVGVLAADRFLQVGAPEEVYQRPRCPFVARLLGDANLFTVESVEAGQARLDGGLALRRAPGEEINWRIGDRMMVRPEHCRLIAAEEAKERAWSGSVTAVHYLGCDQIVEVALSAGRTVRVRQRAVTSPAILTGSIVGVVVPPEARWLLPEADPAWLSPAGKGTRSQVEVAKLEADR